MRIEENFIPKLKPNENILWCGAPKRGFLLKDSDMILIPISIIMLGFSFILDYILISYDSPLLYKPLGVVFTLIGLYIGFFRLVLDARRRKNTMYCLTNKRILRLDGKHSGQFQTLQLKDIQQLDKTIEKDGSGFILFGTINPLIPWLLGGFTTTKAVLPGLEFVPDVELVYEKISLAISSHVDPLVLEKIKPGEDSLN